MRNSNSGATNPLITVIDGDGIGPELMDSVTGVLAAADVPVTLQRFSGPVGYFLLFCFVLIPLPFY